MIDVYIGVIGDENSVLSFEFDNFADASRFCDTMAEHYREERKKLYLAIDTAREFESLEEVFKNDAVREDRELDSEAFGEILKMHRDGRICD